MTFGKRVRLLVLEGVAVRVARAPLGAMQLEAARHSTDGPSKRRAVSPGLAARMSMFGDANTPNRGKMASPRGRRDSPRRAVSPRLKERVDSFSRGLRAPNPATMDAPIVRGVNDRPTGSTALRNSKVGVGMHHTPASGVKVPSLVGDASRGSSSSVHHGTFLPPLSLSTACTPALTGTERLPSAGETNVELQRSWLEQQVREPAQSNLHVALREPEPHPPRTPPPTA